MPLFFSISQFSLFVFVLQFLIFSYSIELWSQIDFHHFSRFFNVCFSMLWSCILRLWFSVLLLSRSFMLSSLSFDFDSRCLLFLCFSISDDRACRRSLIQSNRDIVRRYTSLDSSWRRVSMIELQCERIECDFIL